MEGRSDDNKRVNHYHNRNTYTNKSPEQQVRNSASSSNNCINVNKRQHHILKRYQSSIPEQPQYQQSNLTKSVLGRVQGTTYIEQLHKHTSKYPNNDSESKLKLGLDTILNNQLKNLVASNKLVEKAAGLGRSNSNMYCYENILANNSNIKDEIQCHYYNNNDKKARLASIGGGSNTNKDNIDFLINRCRKNYYK